MRSWKERSTTFPGRRVDVKVKSPDKSSHPYSNKVTLLHWWYVGA